MADRNGWSEYEKLVLNELERHNLLIEHIRKDLSQIQAELAMLKVKSGIWGVIGASITLFVAFGLNLVKAVN